MRSLILPILLSLSACGGSTPESQSESDEVDDPMMVTRTNFEARDLNWPLTVDSGRVGCTNMARWVEVDGTRYGLNGFASVDRGYAEIEPIWSIDEVLMTQLREAGVTDGPTLRISIGDLSSEAELYCE